MVALLAIHVVLTALAMTFGILGLIAFIQVKAFEKSTHNIEYVPISHDDIKRDDNTDWKKMEEELNKPVKKFLEDDFFPDRNEG